MTTHQYRLSFQRQDVVSPLPATSVIGANVTRSVTNNHTLEMVWKGPN
jgi:hypothetical protein